MLQWTRKLIKRHRAPRKLGHLTIIHDKPGKKPTSARLALKVKWPHGRVETLYFNHADLIRARSRALRAAR